MSCLRPALWSPVPTSIPAWAVLTGTKGKGERYSQEPVTDHEQSNKATVSKGAVEFIYEFCGGSNNL